MSSPAFYPKFRATDPSTGLALVGGKLYTYAAGTTTPQATYSDAALTSANANPIILDANGEASIYVGANAYKFVLQDSTGAAIWTFDNYAPNLATPSPYPSGWVQYLSPVTFVNTTNFSVTGDQTTTFTAKRRLRSSNTAGTIYSTIVGSTFAAGITTVTLVNDSGVLDSGLSAVYYGIESYTNPSYLDPRSYVHAYLTANTAMSAVATQLTGMTEFLDTLGEFSGGTFTAKYPGYYMISGKVVMSDSAAAGQQMLAEVWINGAAYARTRVNSRGANLYDALDFAFPMLLAAGDTAKLYAYGTATGTAYGGGGPTMTTFSIVRQP